MFVKKIAHTSATWARRFAALVLLSTGVWAVNGTVTLEKKARAEFVQVDAELNKTYQAVLKKLPGAETQKLKEAQRAWIASRDAEAARAAKGAESGSMAPALRYEAMTDLTQKRIKELKAMLDQGADSGAKASSTAEPVREQSPSVSETERTSSSTASTVSPDKKWEYSGGDNAKLTKVDSGEVAVDFSDGCNLGALSENSKLYWAPDSKRFAFYACGSGKEHLTLLYQLSDGSWKPLTTPGDGDELFERAGNVIDAQSKRKGMPKKSFLHMNFWTVEPTHWLDSNTLVVHASMAETAHKSDGEYAGAGFSTDLLCTLKFDEAGNWKVVNTREMTGKAAESPSKSSPLADKVLYQSPGGSYRIQASADGRALWIVPASDPNRRKPLLGADPDNRSPEEFSGSPDETWLFDNRQHELYRNPGEFAFSVFNRKQWFWKNALDYASKEFHLPRKEIDGDSAGWSFDSARLLITLMTNLRASDEAAPETRFVYFNTRTKAFEQTLYLRMVNSKLHTKKPWETFPSNRFTGEPVDRYLVYVEPIEPPPSEAILKPRFTALDEEMNTLREKRLADLARRGDNSIVEFNRSENDKWNKARDEAVQLYLPFAPKDQQEIQKLQFLCDVTQKEVNGLKEP